MSRYQEMCRRYQTPVAARLRDDPTSCSALRMRDVTAATDEELFNCFVNNFHPPNNDSLQCIEFICRIYVAPKDSAAVCAKDLTTLRSDLEDFTIYSENLKCAGQSTDIQSYKSWQDLKTVLSPFRQKRALKQASRAKINAETTIIYTGPEGKIVIPHTTTAVRFWSANTRWCFNQQDNDSHFDLNNYYSPIVIFLPKHDYKMALVAGKITDCQDKKVSHFSEDVKNLIVCAEKTLSPCALVWLRALGFSADLHVKIATGEVAGPVPRHWQKLLDKVAINASVVKNYPKLRNNPEFMLLAVKRNYPVMQYASERLKQDRGFVMAAVQMHCHTLAYAPAFQDDEDIVIQSHSLQYAAPALKMNRDFCLRLIKRLGVAIISVPAEIRDEDFIRDAIKTNYSVLGHLPHVLRRREVMLAAVSYDGRALQLAAPRFKSDKEIVLAAVRENGAAIYYADPVLQEDPEIIRAALERVMQTQPYKLNRLLAHSEKAVCARDMLLLQHKAVAAVTTDNAADLIAARLDCLPALYGRLSSFISRGAAAGMINSQLYAHCCQLPQARIVPVPG